MPCSRAVAEARAPRPLKEMGQQPRADSSGPALLPRWFSCFVLHKRPHSPEGQSLTPQQGEAGGVPGEAGGDQGEARGRQGETGGGRGRQGDTSMPLTPPLGEQHAPDLPPASGTFVFTQVSLGDRVGCIAKRTNTSRTQLLFTPCTANYTVLPLHTLQLRDPTRVKVDVQAGFRRPTRPRPPVPPAPVPPSHSLQEGLSLVVDPYWRLQIAAVWGSVSATPLGCSGRQHRLGDGLILRGEIYSLLIMLIGMQGALCPLRGRTLPAGGRGGPGG
ncbi:unnamed protein product [Gadus morhua 'NCC']